MSYGIKVGGVWKTDPAPSIKVGGVWKTPDKIHIRVGGVWKEVWSSGAVANLAGAYITGFTFGAIAYAGIYLYSSGTYQGKTRKRENNNYTTINSTTDFVIPATASDGQYDIYASKTGDTVSGSTLNAWINDFTTPGWYVSDNTLPFGGSSAVVTLQIRYAGGSVLDTGAYTLEADREDF